MPSSVPGLYETLITEDLTTDLAGIGSGLHVVRDSLNPPEAANRIALHLGQVIERSVYRIRESERSARSIEIAQKVVDLLHAITGDSTVLTDRPVTPGAVLLAIQRLLPDGRPEAVGQPETPLLDTTLLTNSPNEPRLGTQILSEIGSADRIDIVMAFVRMSGIRPLLGSLRRHCEAGRALRLLTTTYTGSTELSALQALQGLGAQVRVSYDTSGTRLHAKSWVFHRASGYTTAFIGSSNLTHSAQVTGLEWNVRVSGIRNPEVTRQIEAVFESYWNSKDFVLFETSEFRANTQQSPSGGDGWRVPIELRPELFQARLLEQIELSRHQGHHRNLLVAATGTGKTVMAALDYVRLKQKLPRARLLFVAHREEILAKSRDTFRIALREPAFGEDWVGGRRPTEFEHVFASIQSLSANNLDQLSPSHFDIVIVDEFHHAAAATYERLLSRVKPQELLGLTATPERADGLSVLKWFDGRIAAELRLWDAIDQQRLVPFVYYGVHDGTDLRAITWRRGTGYDTAELTNVLTKDHVVARFVLKALSDRVDSVERIRALGFCVSVEHAKFMARIFNEAGVPSLAVWTDTPREERQTALRNLNNGSLRVLFSVDLFNEGIDIPAVDTLLMLRPTESATLFLQQLGRGLRLHPGKSTCTVLDFVGLHRAEFRYDKRLRALLGGDRKSVLQQIETGFPLLPAGCHMELDRVATDIILESIRRAVPSTWALKASALRGMTKARRPSLFEFLASTDLELADVYPTPDRSWSDLLEAAGIELKPSGPQERALRRAIGRLLHIDDAERIHHYIRWLRADEPPVAASLSDRDAALIRMLVVSLTETALGGRGTTTEGLELIWAHPQVRAEIVELLEVLDSKTEHLPIPLASHPSVPLSIHARYTRLEILAAMGLGSGVHTPQWREGVYWASDAHTDLLAFTFDKSAGRFSPTTRYRDFAISQNLIHWESQSGTRSNSNTGRRYITHRQLGSHVLLFARHTTDDRSFYLLGPAAYVSHESDSPMAITWELEVALSSDLFASFAAAVS